MDICPIFEWSGIQKKGIKVYYAFEWSDLANHWKSECHSRLELRSSIPIPNACGNRVPTVLPSSDFHDCSGSDFNLTFFQFFNIVMRSAFEQLQLKQINRNYYDPAAAIAVPQFNLEIWPGYITTVRQHEHNLLLNAEVSNKILR